MRVFLSYSPSDAALARQIASELEHDGHETLLPGDAPAGTNVALEVGRALEQSDAMVVLVSPESMKSTNVQREIEYALGLQRYEDRLVPVLVRPTTDIPWILRRFHLLRADKDGKKAAVRVARALRSNKVTG